MFIDYKMFILNDKLSYSFIHFDNKNNCEKRSFFLPKKKRKFLSYCTTKIHCTTSEKRNVPKDTHTIRTNYLYMDISFETFNLHLPVLRTVMFKTRM